MNALALLLGLLVLSYIGTFLVGDRALRGFGLPSGSEYLVLGFSLGPAVLGVVDRSMLAAFDPIADVALGWLALVIGFEYALEGKRRVRLSSLIAACSITVMTAGAVMTAELFVAFELIPEPPANRWILAGAIGAACSETTRHAVRWVVERKRAEGPLSTLLSELAEGDDIVPILATAVLFAYAKIDRGSVAIPEIGWAGITVGLGVLLGLVAAALLGREFRLHESWGVLIGTALFGIGLAARLGLSFLAVMFTMGMTLVACSRHRDEIAAMVAPTERAILLPALVLAGARVEPRAAPGALVIVGIALAARLAAKLGAGWFVLAAFRPARAGGPFLGLGLLSTGALAVAIGLAFALRFPGPTGDTVLFAVVVVTVFGEFVGPARLRSALSRAGEIPDPRPPAPPPEPGVVGT